MSNPVIMAIAEAHGKTSAQVILRWHLQAGYIAIPGSSNPDHIAENLAIFDFELTDEEMKQIEALDTGNRYENW
ncbi:MAG: aldo/keto reductase [Eubacteriales bacterium]|nr:aldo/keto reductase [Eubacteriales bacterium]